MLSRTDAAKSVSNSVTHGTTNDGADSCHHSKADSHTRELSGSFIASCILSHVKSTFLLICITFDLPLCRYSARFYFHALCLSLLLDNANLLAKFRFSDFRILTIVQFFKLNISRVILWLNNGG